MVDIVRVIIVTILISGARINMLALMEVGQWLARKVLLASTQVLTCGNRVESVFLSFRPKKEKVDSDLRTKSSKSVISMFNEGT